MIVEAASIRIVIGRTEKTLQVKDINHRMQNAKCLQLLGIARRAGKLLFGEEPCLQAVRDHTGLLVILDAQVSQNTEKRFVNACTHHGMGLWRFHREGMNVAHAVGRERNKTIALTDPGFYGKLLRLEEEALAQAMSKEGSTTMQEAADTSAQGVEV